MCPTSRASKMPVSSFSFRTHNGIVLWSLSPTVFVPFYLVCCFVGEGCLIQNEDQITKTLFWAPSTTPQAGTRGQMMGNAFIMTDWFLLCTVFTQIQFPSHHIKNQEVYCGCNQNVGNSDINSWKRSKNRILRHHQILCLDRAVPSCHTPVTHHKQDKQQTFKV